MIYTKGGIMSVRVMKKAFVAIFVSMAVLVSPDWAGRNAGFAGSIVETATSANKPNTVYVFHSGVFRDGRILDGFKSACPAGLQTLKMNRKSNTPEMLKICESMISSDENGLILAVGDHAYFVAALVNARRTGRNQKPLPAIYANLVVSPEKTPFCTGVAADSAENAETRLRVIAKVFPGKRIGVIHDPDSPFHNSVGRAREVAKKLNVKLVARPVSSFAPARVLLSEFDSLMKDSDVYWELFNPYIMPNTDLAYDFCRRAKQSEKPSVTVHDSLVGPGPSMSKRLMAINDDYFVVGEQAGEMANKILAGASPKDIPQEKPASGVITVNSREADWFKLKIGKEIAPKGWKFRFVKAITWTSHNHKDF